MSMILLATKFGLSGCDIFFPAISSLHAPSVSDVIPLGVTNFQPGMVIHDHFACRKRITKTIPTKAVTIKLIDNDRRSTSNMY